jgi:transposase-like protein
MAKKYSNEQVRKALKDLSVAGNTIESVAKKNGMSRGTLSYFSTLFKTSNGKPFSDENLTIRDSKPLTEDCEKLILDLHKKGCSVAYIAEIANVSTDGIMNVIRKNRDSIFEEGKAPSDIAETAALEAKDEAAELAWLKKELAKHDKFQQYTPKVKKAVKKLLKSTSGRITVVDLAKELGLSPGMLANWKNEKGKIKKGNRSFKGRTYLPIDWNTIIALHKQGLTHSQIIEKTGINSDTLRIGLPARLSGLVPEKTPVYRKDVDYAGVLDLHRKGLSNSQIMKATNIDSYSLITTLTAKGLSPNPEKQENPFGRAPSIIEFRNKALATPEKAVQPKAPEAKTPKIMSIDSIDSKLAALRQQQIILEQAKAILTA